MKARIRTHGLDGLAQRLAARHLPPAAAAASTAAARDLAGLIAAETGAAPAMSGPPSRRVVAVGAAGVLARIRGSFDRPGDGVLDRLRLIFMRTHRGRRR